MKTTFWGLNLNRFNTKLIVFYWKNVEDSWKHDSYFGRTSKVFWDQLSADKHNFLSAALNPPGNLKAVERCCSQQLCGLKIEQKFQWATWLMSFDTSEVVAQVLTTSASVLQELTVWACLYWPAVTWHTVFPQTGGLHTLSHKPSPQERKILGGWVPLL